MKCEICGKGITDGVNLSRANQFGVKGIWRCDKHHCAESFSSAAAVSDVVEAITGKETRQ